MYTEQSNLPLPRRYRAVLERTRSTQRVPRPVPGRRARGASVSRVSTPPCSGISGQHACHITCQK
jgi:hypothetical protein